MRQRARAHAHLDAGRQAGLAAVQARHAELAEPAAPAAVGQDHGLGHDQVERRAALARADLHLLVAGGLRAVVADEAEVVVGPAEVLGLAAHHFALRLQVLGQAEQERQRRAQLRGGVGGVVRIEGGVFEPGLRDDGVELVVAQVGDDRHAFELRLGGLQLERGFVEARIERHGRAVAAFEQRVGVDHLVGQHGDLVARHVHGGHARTRHGVDGAARRERQARRGDVDADRDGVAAHALHGQRVVDFGGLRVVDREGPHAFGQRQVVGDGRRRERGKAGALGEVLEQEAPPVELVGRIDGAGALQQIERRALRGARGVDHGLVLGRVLVGLEQDLVELLADRRWAHALGQLPRPFDDLRLDGFLLLDGGQRLLHDLGRRLLEAPLARAAEVVRRLEQREQRGGLLRQRGLVAEIVGRQVGKAELAFGCEFPGEVEVHGGGERARLGHQLGRGRLLETQNDVGALDLDALAGLELDLCRGFGFRQDAAAEVFAGFFKQYKHPAILPRGIGRASRPGANARRG
ncbi:hypothetical protein D3C72_737640 [compost metagenome]